MRRLGGKNPVSRSMNFFVVLAAGVGLLEFLFHADGAMIWTVLVAMFIMGGLICLMPLDIIRGYDQTNRWHQAVSMASWVLCVLLGALVISAAVAWVIAGPTLEGFPVISELLLAIGIVGAIVGALLIGGLTGIGAIAKATEETRESARSWGRTRGAAGARSAEEDSPPE